MSDIFGWSVPLRSQNKFQSSDRKLLKGTQTFICIYVLKGSNPWSSSWATKTHHWLVLYDKCKDAVALPHATPTRFNKSRWNLWIDHGHGSVLLKWCDSMLQLPTLPRGLQRHWPVTHHPPAPPVLMMKNTHVFLTLWSSVTLLEGTAPPIKKYFFLNNWYPWSESARL